MFPIRDHNPSNRTPYVTWALLAINVVVFLAMLPLGDGPELWEFYGQWALVPAESDPVTFVTSMFIHGGVMHIIGNMLFLWIFGDNLEDQMGHFGFLVFYLATGVLAAFAHIWAGPDSIVPTVGASGAIAGVMGGYLLLFPKARVDVLVAIVVFFRVFTVPAWVMLGIWFGIQIFSGAGADPDTGGVAYWAHAGGFLAGLAISLPFWLAKGGSAFWRDTEGHPPHPDGQWTRVPKAGSRRS